jgi:2-keto-4-pentenoate hydratase/2-oxohepta-3-ene-1,7-dioic acid hydratase in catechol pathway
MHSPIKIPHGKCHNELEVALLIGKPISSCSLEQGLDAVMGIGLGLDLTLRDLQNQLKQAGHPWERAKAFDNSCPLSKFVLSNRVDNWQNIDFTLILNQQIRQQGSTKNMLFPIAELLIEITRNFSLSAGDVVLTGTPSGVGPLRVGDEVQAELGNQIKVKTNIIK